MDGINFGLLKIAAFLSPFFPPLLLRSDTMRSVTKLQQQQHDTSREELPAFYQGLILLKRDFNGLDNLWIWPALTSDSIGKYAALRCWMSTVFHWLITHRNHFSAIFSSRQVTVFKTMSAEDGDADLPFRAEYAKSGRASCKACKTTIEKGALRLAVMVQVRS